MYIWHIKLKYYLYIDCIYEGHTCRNIIPVYKFAFDLVEIITVIVA